MYLRIKKVVAKATGSMATRPRSKGTSPVRFLKSEDGAIGLMFGLTFTMMVLFVAGALDLSRWLSAKTDTLAAVDAAVLAGGRSLQVQSNDPAAAVAVAQRYYEENTRNLTGIDDQVQFVTAQNNTAVRAQGNAYIQTPFLNVIGIPRLPLIKAADGEFAEAVVAAGGNSQMSVEISLMLDITGSMCDPCTKLSDLKLAAKDLIDIVVWQDQSQYTSRVALVPFSEAINVGTASWTSGLIKSGSNSISFKDKSGKNRTFYRDSKCATERTGPQALSDALPAGTNLLGTFYDSNGTCNPTSGVIMPLTSDKSALKSAIDAYQASGATAGHLGTAWAWYMLSPHWAPKLPSASAPQPYSMLSELNPRGQPKLRKIAILMTDGEYNTQYCSNGVSTSYASCSVQSSNTQARNLCTAMKAAGITVYTVGFQMPDSGSSVTTLQQCASDSTKYYNAENGDALRQAFRDIALQISTLHLTK